MVPTDRTATTRRATLPYGRTPMSEAEFSDAWAAADAIQPSELRDRISAMLMLARGAGASAADLRYVAGTDIVTLADAGTWVECRRPGFERRVPVSVRFAEDLQRMARQARRETLIGERGQPLPLPA
ncbi:MAG TPA: hypothetical protein VMV09_04015, partial [Candidatus Saccharimonadales bacterium]|nr:hypothetical protein [Candidatus Saccharimonadales bacterium]